MRHFSQAWLGATCIVAAASCGGDEFAPRSETGGGMAGAAGKSSGGTSGAATAGAGMGGAGTAGAATAGSGGALAGAPPVAGGPPGGASSMGGGPPLAGGPPMAGSGGGMSQECRDQADCQKCCDQRFPDQHGPFAGKFHTCGCDSCGQACTESLCMDAFSWSDACLSCIREQIPMGCSAAALACSDAPGCEEFAACSFSCL